MSIRNIYLAHELDAAWIIALWKAIHGGDPAPEAVAAEAIAALAQYLRGAEYSFTFAQLEKQFANLGVQVTERSEEAEAKVAAPKPVAAAQAGVQSEDERQFRPHQYCFKFKGQVYCIELPRLTHLPTAA
jgi:hypothetical protein